MVVFTEAMKDGVRRHKYACIDTSPLSKYVMHPFWNYVVQFCPKWVAPNTLTVLGFGLTVLNFFILTAYDWDLKSPYGTPRLIWLLSALLVFVSHTLDGIDGKQARRLGLSSPLGELMDHCCDAWTAAFFAPILFSLFSGQLKSSILFSCEWYLIFCFLLAHWEKSITGVLYLPWSYDIGQLTSVVLFLVTFVASPSIWLRPFPFVHLNGPELIPYVAHGAFWFLSIPVSIFNITAACIRDRSKIPTLDDLVRPLFGTIFVFLVSWFWMVRSPTHIIEQSPRLFLLCGGTLAANITSRVILADVTKTKAPMWCDLMGIYSLMVFVLCLGLPRAPAARIEYSCLFGITSYFTVMHLIFAKDVIARPCEFDVGLSYLQAPDDASPQHYESKMINEMCTIFNIRAFLVGPGVAGKDGKT
ncbi:hypothetical protein Aperf_G00000130338 [Anoplocephala perfoliata]